MIIYNWKAVTCTSVSIVPKECPEAIELTFVFTLLVLSILDNSSLPLLQIVACFPKKSRFHGNSCHSCYAVRDFAHMPTSWTMEDQIFSTLSSALRFCYTRSACATEFLFMHFSSFRTFLCEMHFYYISRFTFLISFKILCISLYALDGYVCALITVLILCQLLGNIYREQTEQSQ